MGRNGGHFRPEVGGAEARDYGLPDPSHVEGRRICGIYCGWKRWRERRGEEEAEEYLEFERSGCEGEENSVQEERWREETRRGWNVCVSGPGC